MSHKKKLSPHVELEGVWYPVSDDHDEVGIGGIITRRFLPENSRIVVEARNGHLRLDQKYVITRILPDTVGDNGVVIRRRQVEIFPRI